MSCIVVEGRRRLEGSISVQTAKNGVLPVLAATILNTGVTVIERCPKLSDVDVTISVLEGLGCQVHWEGDDLVVDASSADGTAISCELMHKMRSSVIFLGSLLGKMGRADICLPGGCELGTRPIDIHVNALEKMGAKFTSEDEIISCVVTRRTACELILPKPSVGATENIMLFAVTCKGTTRIINAAKEPEISDLQDYLNAIGYRVKGAGSPVIEIEGKSELPATYVRHRPIPDRIAAATWLCAGAMTGGTVELRSVRPDHMKAALDALKESGSMIHVQGDRITLIGPPRPKAIPRLKTSPFPGFPTDAQPLFFALASVSKGRTFIEETMFENRFSFGPDLARMGAGVFIRGKFAAIDGTSELKGQSVVAKDLRGGAALVLAGLAAEGQTIIDQAGYIDRGYEHIEKTLALLGASIWRT